MPGTADKLRKLIESGGSAIEGPFDGEESITLMADLDAGATGTMPSAMIPDLIKPVVEHHLAGRRTGRRTIWKDSAFNQLRKPSMRSPRNQSTDVGRRSDHFGQGQTSHACSSSGKPEGVLELAKVQEPVVLRWGNKKRYFLQTTFFERNRSISETPNPSSVRISSVCSPLRGDAF